MPRAVKLLVCLECTGSAEQFMIPENYRVTYMFLHARKRHGHTAEGLGMVRPRPNWQDGSQEWIQGRGRHAPVLWQVVSVSLE